jgi:hypothetical protein
MLLTVAVAINYGARMRRKRKHWVYPLIVEKVSTMARLQFHVTCLSIPINSKKCIVCPRNLSLNCVNMLDRLY